MTARRYRPGACVASESTKPGGGKHNIKMEKAGERPITLPMHKGQQYSKDLTRSILKQAGII